jgi:catechol 2,3-dioxygenase-like lactoylglutathione lyase family enzyme
MQIRTIIAALVWMVAGSPLLPAQSVELDGIAHVALRVSDLEKTREFYEKLGFEEAFVFSDAGKTTESFIKINDRQFLELYPRTQDSQRLGLMHVCFEAPDIESVRNAYTKEGLAPPEAKKFRAGNLLFVLHDPEGQVVEYTQYLPGSLHAEDRGKHLGEHRIAEHLQGATTIVKDLAVERAFYVDKLGLEANGVTGTVLRVPGNTRDEVELETGLGKSEIVFSVGDVRRAAELLRQRGLSVSAAHDAVRVTDPDGTVVVFRAARSGTKR